MYSLISIASVMAISSGILLVLGPWYVTASSTGMSNTALYFFVYVVTVISMSSVFGGLLDKKGGGWGLRVASATRIFLVAIVASSIFVFKIPSTGTTILFALLAAIPDSVFRVSITVFTKEILNDDSIQKASGYISAARQIGYMAGTAIAGLILFIKVAAGGLLFALLILSCAAYTVIFFNSHRNSDRNKRPFKRNSEERKRPTHVMKAQFLWAQIKQIGAKRLFVSLLILSTLAYLLPMNVAPLILKVKNLSPAQLGTVETFFSIGTFCGALFYSRFGSRLVLIPSFAIFSCTLIALTIAPYPSLLAAFLLLGFVINVCVPVSAELVKKCPVEFIGRVSASLQSWSSALAASVLGITSLGNFGNPILVYVVLSCAVAFTAGYLFFPAGAVDFVNLRLLQRKFRGVDGAES